MITELPGRIFHMHIRVGTEDIIANVNMEASRGLLIITTKDSAVTGYWPDKDQWGTETFEEFLCSRTPSWIVSKMLGRDAGVFDKEKTTKLADFLIREVVPKLLEYIAPPPVITHQIPLKLC